MLFEITFGFTMNEREPETEEKEREIKLYNVVRAQSVKFCTGYVISIKWAKRSVAI